jgi:hypothetical protein
MIWKVLGFEVTSKSTPPNTYTIQSPPCVLDPQALASELIDQDTRWWKRDLLETIFWPEEVSIIQAIPISYTNYLDR